jgi:hypothetical protein
MSESSRGNKISRTRSRTLSLLAALAVIVLCAPRAHAQILRNFYPNFTQVQSPGHLTAVLYGGGFGSDKYGTAQQGFQLEQSITHYIGLVGRVTGYQLWVGQGFDNPLNPGTGHAARLNFVRLQGGLDFLLYPGTHLYLLGGGDLGDSSAGTIEGDFSSWWFLHSHHPINFSFSAIHNWENQVTSSEMDLRMIVMSSEQYLLLAGIGGAVYGGGFITAPSVQGQGGPDLGVYLRKWGFGADAQAGYGSAHQYGQLSLYKVFDFPGY